MDGLSDDSSDDADLNWQIVPTKRKHIESPKHQKRANILAQANTSSINDKFEQPSTSISSTKNNQKNMSSNINKYAALSTEDNEVTPDVTPKPPPIYIPNVQNINLMVKKISTVISNTEFNYKSVREGEVRLMVKSVDSYRKVVKYLETVKILFHTYQLKQERAYRVVIKGLHHSTPIDDIKAELISLGHPVRSVTNVKSRVTKEPLSMFFVDLNQNENNKTIYEISHINHAIVTVEAPKKTIDLVQCHRCQQFGHTKSYCKKPFRCVKCGMDHATAECKKSIDTPPRCVHCLMNHTASYKGCQVYKNLILNRNNRQKVNHKGQNNTNFNFNSTEFPQINENMNSHSNQNRYNMSYSEAARPQSNENARLERLERMMENLMNMMTMLMARQCN